MFIFNIFLLFRYSVIFQGWRTWLVLCLSWVLCCFVAVVVSMTEEPSIWYICQCSKGSDYTTAIIPILKFLILFVVPLLLIELIYSRIYLEARANSEKVRKGLSSLRSDSSNKSSREDLSRKNSSDSDSELLKSRRSDSFKQRIARSEIVRNASNASSQFMSNIRKRVIATHLFIKASSFALCYRVCEKFGII